MCQLGLLRRETLGTCFQEQRSLPPLQGYPFSCTQALGNFTDFRRAWSRLWYALPLLHQKSILISQQSFILICWCHSPSHQGGSGSQCIKENCPSVFCMSPLPHPSGREQNCSQEWHFLWDQRILSHPQLMQEFNYQSHSRIKTAETYLIRCLEVEPFRSEDQISPSEWKIEYQWL